MKLYLAAPYAGRDIVRDLMPVFVQAGHVVLPTWITRPALPLGSDGFANLGTSAQHAMEMSGEDLATVDLADVLVHFTATFLQGMDPTLGAVTHNLHSGGRHVETGFALAKNKSVITLGDPENIFQRGLTHVCPTLADALDVLDEMSEDWA